MVKIFFFSSENQKIIMSTAIFMTIKKYLRFIIMIPPDFFGQILMLSFSLWGVSQKILSRIENLEFLPCQQKVRIKILQKRSGGIFIMILRCHIINLSYFFNQGSLYCVRKKQGNHINALYTTGKELIHFKQTFWKI